MTPCYLSSKRLFHLLATPPDQIWEQLSYARLLHRDGCGRKALMSSTQMNKEQKDPENVPNIIAVA